ncbi:MAG: hypothetical protein RL547_53, partial [Actinomycetota bacterium]
MSRRLLASALIFLAACGSNADDGVEPNGVVSSAVSIEESTTTTAATAQE